MDKPGMIITGATGFLGGRLIRQCCQTHRVICVARRPPPIDSVPEGADFECHTVDIGDFERLREIFYWIREAGDVEMLLHLAGYYDFTGDDHPEYLHTNVIGTRNVLELSVPLGLRRLFFVSSIAACPFPKPGQAITEDTPPTAPPPYSRSKRLGEELLRVYADRIPSCILRLAAIFSNWCEYEPLFNFIETWFSGRWNARVLGGRGQWAIPYLHVRDLVPFLLRVIEMADELRPLEVLQASPNGCTTHLSLFQEATRCHYGASLNPIYVPKPLARAGIRAREVWGRLTGNMPFERSWMGEYIDLQLNVDATRTHQRLGWTPRPELDILNCIPAMIQNRAEDPVQWQLRFEQSKKGGFLYE